MFEIKLIEDWMKEYEEQVFNNLVLTDSLMKKWGKAKKEQRVIRVNPFFFEEDGDSDWVDIPEFKHYCGLKVSRNWKMIDAVIKNANNEEEIVGKALISYINVDGVDYPLLSAENVPYEYRSVLKEIKGKYDGFAQLISENGCSMTDVNWLSIGRTEEDIRTKAHKEMLAQKKAIESKVLKICGETLTNVEEKYGEIFTKGSNGKTARIWSILAGGENTDIIVNVKHGQCLHRRVYVKEVK